MLPRRKIATVLAFIAISLLQALPGRCVIFIQSGSVTVFTDDATYKTVDSGDGHSFTLHEQSMGDFTGFPNATLALKCPSGLEFNTSGNQVASVGSSDVSVMAVMQLPATLSSTISITTPRTGYGVLQFDNIDIRWTSAVPGTYYVTYDQSQSSGYWGMSDGAVVATITVYDGGARFMTNGTGGGAFNSSSTWFGGATPSSTDSVTVQAGDVLTMTTGSVGDFVVESGASVVHSSNSDLSIYGDYVLHGTHSGGNISSDVNFEKSDGIIDGTGTLSVEGRIYFKQDLIISEDADITFASIMSMTTGRSITNYGIVTLETPYATLNSGGAWIQTSGATLNVGYDLVWNLDATATGNAVNYVRTNGQNFNPTTYYNLSTSGAGNKTMLHGDIVVTNTLTIGNNTHIDAKTSSLTLLGDLINNNTTPGAGYYQSVSTNGTVVFGGTSDQLIQQAGGMQEFENLTINKASGNLILSSTDLEVSGLVTLISGDIVLGNSDLVVSGQDRLVGGSISSYVQCTGSGMLEVPYTSASGVARTFPIGDASDYLPIEFQLNSATLAGGAKIRYSVTPSAHPEKGISTSYINRYYTFDPTGFSGAIDYDITYSYLDTDVVGVESELKAAKYDAAGWMGGNGGAPAPKPWTSINTSTNTIAWEGADSFSDGTALDGNVILPVRLLDFDAKRISQELVRVAWSTASEEQNDFFTIERSEDGMEYAEIHKCAGSGDSDVPQYYMFYDRRPLKYGAFYRLVQTDYDGSTEIFPATYVSGVPEIEIVASPNPFSGSMLQLHFASRGDALPTVRVRDATGRRVHCQVSSQGSTLHLYFEDAPRPGIYIVQLIAKSGELSTIKVVCY